MINRVTIERVPNVKKMPTGDLYRFLIPIHSVFFAQHDKFDFIHKQRSNESKGSVQIDGSNFNNLWFLEAKRSILGDIDSRAFHILTARIGI